MRRPVVVAIGEVLWDVFPEGPRFGGAPANVACHAAALGGEVFVVSRVGEDELGTAALSALREHDVRTDHVGRHSSLPTGTVQVAVDGAGKPTFTIQEDVAWDAIEWSGGLSELAARAEAVCFGTLAQRSDASRSSMRRFLAATSPGALRIVDINLRPPFDDQALIEESIRLANVLKLSDDELPRLVPDASERSEVDALRDLLARFELKLVAMTRGARGALLVEADRVSEFGGVPTEVKDTVGAGDSFTAALALGLLRGDDLDAINETACRVAAWVCSQSGATPSLPDSFRPR